MRKRHRRCSSGKLLSCRQFRNSQPSTLPLFRTFTSISPGLAFRWKTGGKSFRRFPGERGEQAKILLLRLFATRPDILLLDEPTNHLDLETVEWLEDEVRAYPKAVVMVSHDRYFIDRTADVVWEVSGGKLTRYVGNYTAYRTEKQKRHERQLRQYGKFSVWRS